MANTFKLLYHTSASISLNPIKTTVSWGILLFAIWFYATENACFVLVFIYKKMILNTGEPTWKLSFYMKEYEKKNNIIYIHHNLHSNRLLFFFFFFFIHVYKSDNERWKNVIK